MRVNAQVIRNEVVHINRNGIFAEILLQMITAIRPEEVKSYDDWLILDNGDIVGVSEYRHGTDTSTTVGKATPETLKLYQAINLVRQNIDKLPKENT